MAMLILEFDGISYLNCGGTILDSRHILTLASCLVATKVIVGSTTTALPHFQEILIDRKIKHPSYVSETDDYNYGIIELIENIKFGDTVKPLPLNSSVAYVEPEENLWTYGWGSSRNYTDPDVTLRRVAIPAVSQKECETAFPNVTDRMMCAGYKNGTKNACREDKGGPLIHNGVQVGIAGWNVNCLPYAIYFRVGAVMDWIQGLLRT